VRFARGLDVRIAFSAVAGRAGALRPKHRCANLGAECVPANGPRSAQPSIAPRRVPNQAVTRYKSRNGSATSAATSSSFLFRCSGFGQRGRLCGQSPLPGVHADDQDVACKSTLPFFRPGDGFGAFSARRTRPGPPGCFPSIHSTASPRPRYASIGRQCHDVDRL